MIKGTNLEGVDQEAVTLYLLVDTSASMGADNRIGRVNSAAKILFMRLDEYCRAYPGMGIRVAVLAFSDGCRRIADRSMAPHVLAKCWEDLQAGGFTDMGAAFGTLERSLSDSDGSAVIVLLSDGLPTDDWRGALEKLARNRRFAEASRYAVSLDEINTGILGEFTGNAGNVVRGTGTRDLEHMLWELIREELDTRIPVEIPEEEPSAGDSAPVWGGGW